MCLNCLSQSFSEMHGIGPITPAAYNQEFFAADSAYHVVASSLLGENPGYFNQDDIAVIMPVGVVNPFEAVYIDENAGKTLVETGGFGEAAGLHVMALAVLRWCVISERRFCDSCILAFSEKVKGEVFRSFSLMNNNSCRNELSKYPFAVEQTKSRETGGSHSQLRTTDYGVEA